MEYTADASREANWLLGSLPDDEYDRIASLTETVELPLKTILFEPGEAISHAYFPQDGCLSCVTVVDRKFMIETGAVGFEGMTGLSLVNGVPDVPNRCIVQIASISKRIPAAVFVHLLHDCPELVGVLRRYSQVWADQAGQ